MVSSAAENGDVGCSTCQIRVGKDSSAGTRVCSIPCLHPGNTAGENHRKREVTSWKDLEQHPGVWLQSDVLGKAVIGKQMRGWRFRAPGSVLPSGPVGKPIHEGVRVFMGTSHGPRQQKLVFGVQGTVPGIWRSLVSHGTHSIILPGSCLLLHPIKLLERPGEAARIDSGLGWDPETNTAIHPAE